MAYKPTESEQKIIDEGKKVFEEARNSKEKVSKDLEDRMTREAGFGNSE